MGGEAVAHDGRDAALPSRHSLVRDFLLALHHFECPRFTAVGLGCGCMRFSATVAGSLASWITNPLDLAKLRLQVSRAKAAAAKTPASPVAGEVYTGFWQALDLIYRVEGVKGLFRGSVARVRAASVAPATLKRYMALIFDCLSFRCADLVPRAHASHHDDVVRAMQTDIFRVRLGGVRSRSPTSTTSTR